MFLVGISLAICGIGSSISLVVNITSAPIMLSTSSFSHIKLSSTVIEFTSLTTSTIKYSTEYSSNSVVITQPYGVHNATHKSVDSNGPWSFSYDSNTKLVKYSIATTSQSASTNKTTTGRIQTQENITTEANSSTTIYVSQRMKGSNESESIIPTTTILKAETVTILTNINKKQASLLSPIPNLLSSMKGVTSAISTSSPVDLSQMAVSSTDLPRKIGNTFSETSSKHLTRELNRMTSALGANSLIHTLSFVTSNNPLKNNSNSSSSKIINHNSTTRKSWPNSRIETKASLESSDFTDKSNLSTFRYASAPVKLSSYLKTNYTMDTLIKMSMNTSDEVSELDSTRKTSSTMQNIAETSERSRSRKISKQSSTKPYFKSSIAFVNYDGTYFGPTTTIIQSLSSQLITENVFTVSSNNKNDDISTVKATADSTLSQSKNAGNITEISKNDHRSNSVAIPLKTIRTTDQTVSNAFRMQEFMTERIPEQSTKITDKITLNHDEICQKPSESLNPSTTETINQEKNDLSDRNESSPMKMITNLLSYDCSCEPMANKLIGGDKSVMSTQEGHNWNECCALCKSISICEAVVYENTICYIKTSQQPIVTKQGVRSARIDRKCRQIKTVQDDSKLDPKSNNVSSGSKSMGRSFPPQAQNLFDENKQKTLLHGEIITANSENTVEERKEADCSCKVQIGRNLKARTILATDGGHTVVDCCILCKKLPQCAGFNFINRTCTFKEDLVPYETSEHIISYVLQDGNSDENPRVEVKKLGDEGFDISESESGLNQPMNECGCQWSKDTYLDPNLAITKSDADHSLQQCCNLCLKAAFCKSVIFYRKTCYFYQNVPESEEKREGYQHGIKESDNCKAHESTSDGKKVALAVNKSDTQQPEPISIVDDKTMQCKCAVKFNEAYDTKKSIATFAAKNHWKCCQTCQSLRLCTGYSFIKRVCYLLSSTSSRKLLRGSVSAVILSECPTVATPWNPMPIPTSKLCWCKLVGDSEVKGGNILTRSQSTNPQDCCIICSKMIGCSSFTFYDNQCTFSTFSVTIFKPGKITAVIDSNKKCLGKVEPKKTTVAKIIPLPTSLKSSWCWCKISVNRRPRREGNVILTSSGHESIDQCCELCHKVANCRWFVFFKSTCQIHSDATPRFVRAAGFVTATIDTTCELCANLQWTEWSECSRTCAKGVRRRQIITEQLSNPVKLLKQCKLTPKETKSCNTGRCKTSIKETLENLESVGINADDFAASGSSVISDSLAFISSGMEGLGFTPEQSIYACNFQGDVCDSSNFHAYEDPVMGSCFTFNRDGLKDVHSLGHTSGLRLMLFVGQEDYLCTTETAGYRITIHDPQETPFPDSQGFLVAPGQFSKFSLSRGTVERLPYPYTNCVNGSRDDYLYDGVYTIEGCIRSCLQRGVVQACGCFDPRYPPITTSHECQSQVETQCLDYIFDCGLDILEDLSCDCSDPCFSSLYTVSITSSQIANEIFEDVICHNVSHPSNCLRQQRRNYVSLNLVYTRLDQHSMKETSSYGSSRILSEVANIAGLFLSASVITTVEFAHVCFATVVWMCTKGKLNAFQVDDNFARRYRNK